MENYVSNGAALILAERNEQILKHGKTVAKDAQYENEELISIAMLLVKPYLSPTVKRLIQNRVGIEYGKKLIAKSFKQRLVIAAALIAARIDVIDYESTDISKLNL